MTENDDQARTEFGQREFNAIELRLLDDIAGHTNDEQIAKPLIEHELCRYSRVRAAKDHGKRRLLLAQRLSALRELAICPYLVCDVAAIPLLEPPQRFTCRYQMSDLRLPGRIEKLLEHARRRRVVLQFETAQLEVCLETINHLEDYRAQHYEVSVRLQLDGGEVLPLD